MLRVALKKLARKLVRKKVKKFAFDHCKTCSERFVIWRNNFSFIIRWKNWQRSGYCPWPLAKWSDCSIYKCCTVKSIKTQIQSNNIIKKYITWGRLPLSTIDGLIFLSIWGERRWKRLEEFKAKRHAVKKMTRNGLVETDSREGIVKETAEAKSDEQLGDGPEPAFHGWKDPGKDWKIWKWGILMEELRALNDEMEMFVKDALTS